MISSVSFSDRSVELMQRRGLDSDDMNDFADLLGKAQQEIQDGRSATEVIQDLSSQDLKLVQRAASLADRINPQGLSEEASHNLLAQADGSGWIDPNNDGIVEIGLAKTMTFPPVNAPDSVKLAWDEATADMSEIDKMMMQLRMHHHTYGLKIEGMEQQQALDPSEQWSEAGWRELMAKAQDALSFAVSLDGWTRDHVVEQDFINRFTGALGRVDAQSPSTDTSTA